MRLSRPGFKLTNVIPAGHVAFFGFIAELKDPKDYPKSLVLLQGTDVTLYLITAIVIYCYAGQDVTSPALGSAGAVVAKVAYGVALPTVCPANLRVFGLDAKRINQIIIGGVVNGHVAAKYVFVRLFRNSDLMHRRDWSAWGTWTGIVLVLWIIAWVIAEAIPVFNNLLSLVVRWNLLASSSTTTKLTIPFQASLFASWSTCTRPPPPLCPFCHDIP